MSGNIVSGAILLLSYVGALTLFIVVAVNVYRAFFSPLTKIPGPWMTRVTTALEANALKEHRRSAWLKDLFDERPGAVAVRTGPHSVSFNHPDAVKVIYGASPPSPMSISFPHKIDPS